MTSIWQPNDGRPNIVLILADQWRGDCLSILGHPTVDTPNLDELANRGALFTSAYAACPTCIPARANLMTGRSPSGLGWLGFARQEPWDFETTLPHELKLSGYQTACIGKTHFFPRTARLGFEVLETYEGLRHTSDEFVSDYEEWLAERTGGAVPQDLHGAQDNSWYARPSHLPEELHNNTWVVTRSLEFLRRRDKTRPFFLNVSFHRPHPPFDPPQTFFDLYKDAPLEPVPIGDWAAEHDVPAPHVNASRGRIPDKLLDRARRAYFAQMAHIDVQLGRLMLRMKHMGLYKNTWFVFVSDHGEMLGDHHHFCKASALEGSARIPLIIAPPPLEFEGPQRIDNPVTHMDLMPTMLEATGTRVPDSVEGRSLLPFVNGEAPDPPWREYVHGEHTRIYHAGNAMQYATDGSEKFIWNPITGEELFFDLQEDPGETRNRATEPRAERWRQRLVAELAKRPEDGLSDGQKLIASQAPPVVREGRPV